MSEYYTHGSVPANNALGSSSDIRAEFDAISSGFNKLPVLTGNGDKVVKVNSAGNGLTSKTSSAEQSDTIHAATANATIADADELGRWDSVSLALSKLTFANLWTWIQGKLNFATGVATFLSTPSSANLRAALSDETGTGSAVFSDSPTLVTPNLGTPSTLVGTNITGTAAGLTAGTANAIASGANLGTPSAIVLTNATGTAAGLTAGSATTATNATNATNVIGSAVVTGAVQSGTNPKFTAYLSSNQSLTADTLTKIIWNAEEYDVGSNFDSVTNHRFVAPVAGCYAFSWYAFIGSVTDSVTNSISYLYKNGSAVRYGIDREFTEGITGANMISSGSTSIYLAVNDYVEIFVIAGGGGGTLRVAGDTSVRFSVFSGYLVP